MSVTSTREEGLVFEVVYIIVLFIGAAIGGVILTVRWLSAKIGRPLTRWS